MQKAVYSLFVLLAIFSLIAVAPPAFGDHTTAEVDMAVGSSIVGCETTNECYIPHMVTIDVGGEVMWNNIDAMAHTVTAGTPAEGL
ncbi:MAG TPA: PEFG-CTERM domain-containing protein, partial [Candidatus Nitrosopelagicus sp.]|nr:PEFG-CTERM domain-containing protein [Candidatus Nitrosopelagicus sp.]